MGAAAAATVTVVAAVAEPPSPLQVSVNVVSLVNAAVMVLPLVARAPLQPPLAVQLLALLLPQLNVVVWPASTACGVAVRLTVGMTLTVVVALATPPAPVQVSVKLVAPLNAALLAVPLVPRAPLQPPLAVQLVALLLLQVSVVA